jgi:hypothetical protein
LKIGVVSFPGKSSHPRLVDGSSGAGNVFEDRGGHTMTNRLASSVAVVTIALAVLAAAIPAGAEPTPPAGPVPAPSSPTRPGASAETWAHRSLVAARGYTTDTGRKIERGTVEGFKSAESLLRNVAHRTRSGGERVWAATTRLVRQGLEKL